MNDPPKFQPKRFSPHRTLPPAARRAIRLLVVLPLLCLLTASALYFIALYHLLRANLVPVAAGEASRQTGHEVRIGSASFGTRGLLVLNDIAVSNKATFAGGNGEAALTAKRLTIHYNLHDLLFDSGSAAHALGDIIVDQPNLLVERYKGRFNFSDIFKPKPPSNGKPFVGQLIVHNGTLRFRDYLAPALPGAPPALNTLYGVGATVNLHSERYVYFQVGGRGDGTRFQSVAVSGDASRVTAGRFRARIQVANADAPYWAVYFRNFPQFHVFSGRADADVTMAYLGRKPPPGLPLDLSGSVAVYQAVIGVTNHRIVRVPVRLAAGSVIFTGAGVSFTANASLAGQALSAAGTIFDFSHPQIAVTGGAAQVDARRLALALPFIALPKGLSIAPGPATVQFTGALGNPTITATAASPSLRLAGNQLTEVRGGLVYANKVLSVPSVTFGIDGTGQVAARLTLDSTRKTPLYLIAGSARGVNLAALHLPPNVAKQMPLSGLADADFIADNPQGPLQVTANVSAANLRLRATTLRSVVGRMTWIPGQSLVINRAVARDPAGTASVSGSVPAGGAASRWNLAVAASGLNLAQLLRPYLAAPVGGVAGFRGQITGPISTPSVGGTVQVFRPSFGQYVADTVTGQVTAGVRQVQVSNVIVRRFPTEARISGAILHPGSPNPTLNLAVQVAPGDIQDILALADQAAPAGRKSSPSLAAALPSLTGTTEGTFQITGAIKNPSVVGHALLSDATVNDYRIDRASADVQYENGALHVRNGLVKAGAATLTAQATREKSGAITARFAARDIDLAQFDPLMARYADVDGTVSAAGEFRGTPQSPHLVVQSLTSENLTVDGQRLAPLSLAGRYDDGILTQTGPPWRLVLPLPPDEQSGESDQQEYRAGVTPQVEYQVDSLRLTLPTAAHPRRPAALTMTAQIPGEAPERLPHLLATFRAANFARSQAGRALLAQLNRLPQPIDGAFSLSGLSVTGPLRALTVKTRIAAHQLVLGETRVGDLAADAAYTMGVNPQAHFAGQASGVLAAGIPVGSVTANADLAGRVISVHSLHAESASAFLDASGQANLDGDMTANLDASNIPLALFSALLPAASSYLSVLPRDISELSVQASGPTRSPNLAASISLANPVGTPTGAAYALDRIRSGAITLISPTPGSAAKVLTVSDLAAFKNGRPVATLSGTLPIQFGDKASAGGEMLAGQDLHADLRVQDLSVLALFSPGLLDPKRTSGQLTASLNFGGSASDRRLSGLVTLTDGTLGLTHFDTALNKINGIIVLGNNRASIQSFSAVSSKGGTLTLSGSGELTSQGNANLTLTAKNLTLDENSKQNLLYQNYNSGVQAKINGVISVIGPWLTPLVATPPGAPLLVTDAIGTLPSASTQAAAPRAPSPFDPRFDLAVSLGAGLSHPVSIRSALLRADAAGQVTLQGSLSAPHLRANLTVARGQFILPPSTLLKLVRSSDGEPNTVHAVYPVADASGLPSLETRVNLTAQANVSVTPSTISQYAGAASGGIGEAPPQQNTATTTGYFGRQTQRYQITAHIVGTLNDPNKLSLELTSSPAGLNKQQMLAALVPAGALGNLIGGGSGTGSTLETQARNAIASLANSNFLSPLTEGIANSLDLQDLSVDYAPDAPVLVTLTKDLGQRLEVTYTRQFGARTPGVVNQTLSPPQYTLSLGYGLTKSLQFTLSTDDQRNNTVSFDGVFRF